MKVEIRVNKNNELIEQEADHLQTLPGNVAIDLGHVLSANQALLKNLAKKIDKLENKIQTMESNMFNEIKSLTSRAKNPLLLSAPAKKIKPWSPDYPVANDKYLSKFHWFTRVFFPEKMRRQNVD